MTKNQRLSRSKFRMRGLLTHLTQFKKFYRTQFKKFYREGRSWAQRVLKDRFDNSSFSIETSPF